MIVLKELKTFEPVKRFYLNGFPLDERRELEDIYKLLVEEPSYHLLGVEYKTELVGLFAYWEVDDWIFGEHFTIDATCRNNGIGAEVMRLFKSHHSRIIFEVEPPIEEMACRRIGFYERLGFKLWDMPYVQPPYREGDHSMELRLMTNGEVPTEELVTEIHRKVYGV